MLMDGYLLSLKATLVALCDSQQTTGEAYVTTQAAQVFRVPIAISATYEYKIT